MIKNLDNIFDKKSPLNSIEIATLEDIPAIQKLQEENLIESLSEKEIKEDGFLTLKNTYNELFDIINNQDNKIFTLKDSDNLEAFLISTTKEQASKVKYFNEFIKKLDNNLNLNKLNYCILLQVCIAKKYRGKGFLNDLYQAAKKQLGEKYDLGIGEIAYQNEHSLRAHEKMGFNIIDNYIDKNQRHWHIVSLDLKS